LRPRSSSRFHAPRRSARKSSASAQIQALFLRPRSNALARARPAHLTSSASRLRSSPPCSRSRRPVRASRQGSAGKALRRTYALSSTPPRSSSLRNRARLCLQRLSRPRHGQSAPRLHLQKHSVFGGIKCKTASPLRYRRDRTHEDGRPSRPLLSQRPRRVMPPTSLSSVCRVR